ncbi:hypothetical protein LZD49_11150 [Dyadobacter sp. CY261]|uniref:hypothetical protein n=1 Tax=Dyadobacter sp. CY261 TaxID=2907203 RepID=UPI001F2430FB|nr:hypothetical protein [Dyadobacter sp. CY261]MCF0071030.1 hypothetical protein [Dyadobacter sp. CY261]
MDTLRWQPGLKFQSSDFSIDTATNNVFADIVIHYEYAFQPLKAGNYLPIVHAYAILNRKTATLPDSSERTLRYVQLLFDLSGYQSKLIEWKTFELGELNEKVAPIKPTMDRIFLEATNEVSQLKKDMIEQLSQPDNTQAMAEWEAKLADLLHNTPEIIEEKNVGDFQIGLFAGITRSIFTGKTKDHFTDATGFDFGFNFDIKRSRFELDMNLGFNKTKKELQGKGDWPATMKTHFASIEVTYGVKIHKNKWLAVPYIGLAINEFTPAKSDKDDKRRVDGYSPVVGFELNRLFKDMHEPQEKASFFYRIRASVSPANLIKNYSGTQFNLKVAVGFDVAKVRSRMVKRM